MGMLNVAKGVDYNLLIGEIDTTQTVTVTFQLFNVVLFPMLATSVPQSTLRYTGTNLTHIYTLYEPTHMHYTF